MAKRRSGWPTWKIVVVMIGCAVAAGLCFWASVQLAPVPGPAPSRQANPGMGMSGLLVLFGALSALLSVLCVGWLVYRYYQSIPAWKRQKRYPRRKR